MAAISALMINDKPFPKEPADGDRTPTTPKSVVRIRSPKPQDVGTTTSQESVSTSAEMESTQASSGSSNTTLDQLTKNLSRPVRQSSQSDGMDIDSEDEQEDSDNDGEEGEDGVNARKRKGQRFFCTGYPPCNLSFTRSEHLARHIRKHTGERPFQCHCNRRFSRLDNLRQHAQTVHVNEEIPTDSLAATGTRYQRQIRTDRVRPAPRPRAGNLSSSGGHSRGHSRNLSTSSIGSTASNYSVASTDVRRRPPPLLMAGDNRPSTPPTYAHHSMNSPGDLSTPTSATFPATPGSPNFTSTLGSPMSANSRLAGYPGEARTPTRRLSVPSSMNPYYSHVNPYGSSYPAPPNGPGPAVSSLSSMVTSPTTSTFSVGAGSYAPMADDWRRRTWHPSTYSNLNINYNRPATSGLSYSQTPDAPQPSFSSGATAAAGQGLRLPGIETFDHVQHRPTTPPRRNMTPTQSNAMPVPLLAAPNIEGHRRGHLSWDGSRPSQYPEFDDNGRLATPWGQQTLDQLDQVRDNQQKRALGAPPVMGPPLHSMGFQYPQHIAAEALSLHSSAAKRVKRAGAYSGSQPIQRTSPEDSSSSDGIPTPGTSVAEIHPAIMHSNGYIEPQLLAGAGDAHGQHTVPCLALPVTIPPYQSPYPASHEALRHAQYHNPYSGLPPVSHHRTSSELNRLDALVAVATSETTSR